MNNSKLFFLLSVFIFPSYFLNAYIDPGTGSYLIQILAAGGIAAVYTIKTYWINIKAFFSRNKDSKK